MWFKTPKTLPTPFGEFVHKDGRWQGDIETPNNEEVRITTDNVNGESNPKLLHIIPLIQKNLSHFEAMARDVVEPLSPQYEFDAIDISNLHPDTDFSLAFVCSDGEWSGTISVEFKDEKVTAWWSTD